jgi:hypothetical protein
LRRPDRLQRCNRTGSRASSYSFIPLNSGWEGAA